MKNATFYNSRKKLLSTVGALILAQSLWTGAVAADRQDMTLEAQDMKSALEYVARKSGVNVIARTDFLKGKKTAAISGKYTTKEILDQLLKDSGLVYQQDKEGNIYIRKAGVEKKSQQSLSEDPVEASPINSSPQAVRSSVSGHVTEINTGRNLAGALVRIVETGQTTKTDDLGNFNFPDVAAGNYTIFISFLGYASRLSELILGKGEKFGGEYSLGRPLGELDEIVVFGSRSARALALNLQRMAANSSDIISADELGNFTGTTISEALRRVSGVSFERDFHTGEGVNIIIRGLSPAMNAVKLNGLSLPVGGGSAGGRATSLNSMLADSVERITIHKSLLPSHDSAGTGGLVEIETKSPLNRPHRFVDFGIEGGRQARDFGDDFLVSGTVAGTFGADENFGLSASVQYRENQAKSLEYSASNINFGQYLPLDEDGFPTILIIQDVHPKTSFPFDAGVTDSYPTGTSSSYNTSDSTNLSITLSAEWQVADHTNFKFNVTDSRVTTDSYSRSTNFSDNSQYSVRPVAALDGELRAALTWPGTINVQQSYSQTKGRESRTNTYSLQGHTTFDKWDYKYTLGYVRGTNKDPDRRRASLGFSADAILTADHILAEAIDPIENQILSLFAKNAGNKFPIPLLTEAGWAYLNNSENYDFRSANISSNGGKNDRYTANFSTKYNAGLEHLKYIQLGVDFETLRFSDTQGENVSLSAGDRITNPCCSVIYPSLADIGYTLGESNFADINLPTQRFSVLSEADARRFFGSIGDLATDLNIDLSTFVRDPRLNQQSTKEDNIAAYLETRVDFGRLEIIGGFRMHRVQIHSRSFVKPSYVGPNGEQDPEYVEEFTRLTDESVVQTNILPRVLFNYRRTDNLIFRGGYYLSVARPSIPQITGEITVNLSLMPGFFGPAAGRPSLTVNKGNPDLKSSISHNFDISVEYYHDEIGVIKFSAFYKHINNLIQNSIVAIPSEVNGVSFPDHDSISDLLDDYPALLITGTIPENNQHAARIWGIEGHIERQFTFLPGLWNGFGVFANLSYTSSSKHQTVSWFRPPTYDPITFTLIFPDPILVDYPSTRFDGQPKYSGTLALTYNKHNIDATLAYSFQARRRQFLGTNDLNLYREGVGTLDTHIEYRFEAAGGHYRIYFDGANLLKGPGDPSLQTAFGGDGVLDKYYLSGNYHGGRSFKLGIKATF